MDNIIELFQPYRNTNMRTTLNTFLLVLSILLIHSCYTAKIAKEEPRPQFPVAEREFRAAWIASVDNINWPSRPGLTTEQQKQEALFLLDLLKDHNFNAAILQVRPQCDALYQSELEPWSYYLTGEQGKPPEPYYDPLEFWIEQAHQRGIELHAWLNPYRAHHVCGGEVGEHSVVEKYPELVVKLKTGYWWLDPSKKDTQDHSTAVVMDILKRYDVDGIHFDDYFYPYPSYNNNEDFPDDKSWQVYKGTGGKLSKGDWRRNGVNVFIQRLYQEIKKEKKHVKFGLSPFGIWRPNHPESIKGFDQYEKLYADAKLWLNEGWVDYWTPQLYWPVNRIEQSYPVLLGWWKEQNTKNRHLWPGMSLTGKKGEAGADELLNQIMITRGVLQKNSGNVHWSIDPLVYSQGLVEAVHKGPYKKQALVPASPWLDAIAPAPPEVEISKNGSQAQLSLSHPDKSDVNKWVVYKKYKNNWSYEIFTAEKDTLDLPELVLKPGIINGKRDPIVDSPERLFDVLEEVAVTAIDRFGNESRLINLPVYDISFENAPILEDVLKENKKPLKKMSNLPVVKLGIEVLIEDYLEEIRGKKLGLITNPSAVTRDLRSDIDVLANTPGINLIALFGAEHGVRGAKQGKIFKEGKPDPQTGIPVYSLYGKSFAPKKEWLDKIDILLFDIQGVGSAWYTFKYSMSFAMEACAKAGIPFVVLDRPNPLGGKAVEGPYLRMGSIFRHPLPLRHGMTYGELATMWNDTEGYGADLKVIKMKDWRREMTWDNTGLHWIMPSPNMGTFETAIVYPGQCLFERMNISEARGTTKPFLITGAPWVNAENAASDLNNRNISGAQFRPVYFIPQKAKLGGNRRGKPWNQMCAGVEIMLTDVKSYRSVETALHIIDAYRKTSPDSLSWNPPNIIKLLDQPEMSVEKVIERCQKEIEPFIKSREKYLLYK